MVQENLTFDQAWENLCEQHNFKADIASEKSCLLPVLALSEELNHKMMSFSDNYQENISETMDTIIA